MRHSVRQLTKTLESLQIQERLWSENISRKGIFLHAFLYSERYYTRTK